VGKYLVVAHQTLGGEQLMDEVRRRVVSGPSSFFVLVPTIPNPVGSTEEAERRATLTAQSRLHQALDQFRAEKTDARGDIGDPDPLTAIDVVLAEEAFDEIIISTLPSGLSRWLGMDLPHRVERKFKLPVTTITAKA